MEGVQKLLSNEEEYIDKHKVFIRNMRVSKQDSVDAEPFMKGVFSNLSLRQEREIRVLSIGSGSGNMDKPIIDALTALHPKDIVHYTVLEPMKAAVANYKEMVTSHKAEWSGVEFKYYIQTIEKYLEDDQDDHSRRCERYDVIHAIHAVYYFEKRDGTFRDLYSRLNTNGVMLIRINSECIMEPSIYINRYLTTLGYPSAAVIQETLFKEIPSDTIEIKTTHSNLDIVVTECFKKDSGEGNTLLDFITHISKFRKSMPQEIVKEVLKCLKNVCIEKEGGVLAVNDPRINFVIRKK